ncbi:hypothetical protein DAPPUDRAFT_255466 [Daphnia pulex]|uniref:LysM domain-containing protein n=1 Tax=Daphnia pulex TaxID=6669 RepID=E9H989_DAPPU|nr:hypothetical protein DAPPUDRAFT_255466 [Daphnia pulex]|eukprot:EFX71697.1 hypothetical protein DAPPUDRAFT_255466 [Daphnia pulex]
MGRSLASKAVAAKPIAAMVPQKMSSVSLFLVVVSLFVLINFTDFAYSHKDCDHGFRMNRDDTCWSLAQKCGVSLRTLYHHNGLLQWGNNCGNQPGQYVCCTHWNGRK